jgi:predicted MFS family arabinose efflux permease
MPPRRDGLYERYTAHHHLRATLGAGLLTGVLVLNEVIARKQLGASRWHVLALLLVPATAQFLAVSWNPVDPRRPLGKYPFRAIGIPSRLLLLLFVLAPFLRGPAAFVALVALVQVVDALLLPVQNTTLAGNYSPASHGRWFGVAGAVNALAIACVAVPAGLLLDRRPEAWPWLYAVGALAGVYGYRNWSRLRRRKRVHAIELAERRTGSRAATTPWSLLRSDRPFLAYEACVMVYGLGFMMLQPVLPLYLVDEVRIGYGQFGIARGLLFWLAILVASPILGRLVDRVGVLRVGSLSFLALACFPIGLLLLSGEGALYIAYATYGLAMAGVQVAWNVGPIMLARGRDPMPYLNAHVALVGVRAVIGMVGGTSIQKTFGSAAVFWCVFALELIAALGMWLTDRTLRAARAPA